MQAYVQWINPGINSTVQAFYQNPTIQVITTLSTEAAHAPTLQCMKCTRNMQVTCSTSRQGPASLQSQCSSLSASGKPQQAFCILGSGGQPAHLIAVLALAGTASTALCFTLRRHLCRLPGLSNQRSSRTIMTVGCLGVRPVQ